MAEHLVLAVVALVPQIASARGIVSSDTKAYLYLDPGRFLSQVTSAWDPTVALGTVTHQYVGYLFPMGPYYVLAAALHVDLWIAQRVWLAAILFVAGAGVLRLCEAMSIDGPGRLVAAFAFAFSPYVLQYSGRISVILLPWAALPWLVALSASALEEARAHREEGDEDRTGRARTGRARTGRARTGARTRAHPWRYAALFALVVLATSGINASSFLYVAIAPVLWLVWATAVEHEARARDAALTLLRIVALSVLVSAWWIAGLLVEAGFGIDVLRYTESVRATSSTSTPLEVLRGLGYWYFYGGGHLGPWTRSVVGYTRWIWLLSVSYALPVLALFAGVAVRWRHRSYFVLLVVVGVVLSVGAYPYTHPTIAGGALRTFMTETTAGLAMRSTDRATPLVLLGLSMLLGAGASAVFRFGWRAHRAGTARTTGGAHASGRPPRAGRLAWRGWTARLAAWGAVGAACVLCALVLLDNPALFDGGAAVDPPLTRPAVLPRYELDALDALNETARSTRVLAIPGNAFAAYTWGDTNDTPQPGLLTRPFVTREQQVMGSMATADTLYALDAPIQTQTQSWSALAPMARLLSAGSVMVEYDQRSSLYGAPQAIPLAESLARTPVGLTDKRSYGRPGEGVERPVVDPLLLAGPAHAAPPSPIVTYAVKGTRAILRAEPDRGALVVAGDAAGLESMAADGLLTTDGALLYAGTIERDPGLLDRLVREGATLVVTDTNRKQRFRWNGIQANAGAVEARAPSPTAATPSSSPIQLFRGARSGDRTVAEYVGAAGVTSSSYGNPVTFQPEVRAMRAIDGDLATAWETGTFTPDVDGAWWQVRLARRTTGSHVTLVQPLLGTRKRHITRVTLTFTGRDPVHAVLDASSRRSFGQRVTFSSRSFKTLRVTIDATSSDRGTPVGLAEVEIPGVHVSELLHMPNALLRVLGRRSLGDRLLLVMTRWRVSPYSPTRRDPERVLARVFTLPTRRHFTIGGTASLAASLRDASLDDLVGLSGPRAAGIVATSSSRLTGALLSGASAAVDGNRATAWQSGFGGRQVRGARLSYELPSPITFSRMRLVVVADRRHSIPEAIRVSAATPSTHVERSRLLPLPSIVAGAAPGSTVTVPLSFAPLHGREVTVTFTRVHERRARLPHRGWTAALPLGVSELGIPGLEMPPPPPRLPKTCRTDLLSIDGRPIPLEVVGSSAAALSNAPAEIKGCGWAAHGVELGPGRHELTSAPAPSPWLTNGACAAPHACSGWQIDALVLTSGAQIGDHRGDRSVRRAGAAPFLRAHESSPTAWRAQVTGARDPFELVLGESVNAGWRAVATPEPGAPAGSRAVTLGAPELVDAYANGWQVTASDLRALGAAGVPRGQRSRSAFRLSLVWVPQREEVAGMAVSAAASFGCGCIVLVTRRRRRRGRLRSARAGRERAFDEPSRIRCSPQVRSSPGNPSTPELGWPAGPLGAHVGWRTALVASVASGVCGAAIVQPISGLGAGIAAGVALAVALGLRVGRLRVLGALAGPLLLASGCAVVVAGQALHPVPGGGDWPAAYHAAATVAGVAVVFFGADGVVELIAGAARRRERSPRSPS